MFDIQPELSSMTVQKILDFILGRHRDWRLSDQEGHRDEMRRWNGTHWEYRKASDQEKWEDVASRAW
jgi:hypothetical protein